jgi:hypothetical protein
MLGVSEEDLWAFMNSPEFINHMRERAHVAMLQLLEKAMVEVPRNIDALREIRDTSDSARDRVSAVRAMQDIFKEYRISMPKEELKPLESEEDKMQAIERIREVLKTSGPPPKNLVD